MSIYLNFSTFICSCNKGIYAIHGAHRVNHDFLMTLLGKITSDKMLLKLIARFLRAGMVDDGVWHETPEGVPQGGPLSPLLSNIEY